MKKAFASLLSLLLLVSALPVFALEIGETAPDFHLRSLDGKKVALSDYKGQPVILKLATTWCPTCKQQMEELESIRDILIKQNVAIIEVFVQDTEKMVHDYFAGAALDKNHAVLLDDGTAAKAYHVYAIPRVLLLGPDLKVLRDGNLISGNELRLHLEKLPVR